MKGKYLTTYSPQCKKEKNQIWENGERWDKTRAILKDRQLL